MRRTSLLLWALALGCARVVPPGGGPEDREPPEPVRSHPEPGVVDTLPNRILQEYHERLDPGSASVFLYPDPGHTLRIRGNSLEVLLSGPVPGPTLTLLIPPGIADRRGNRTAAPLNLAWTTADTSMTGSVTFRISLQGGGSVPPGSLLRLFHLPDSLTPFRGALPDSMGMGLLPWLEPGEYLALAFHDRDGSRTWEDQTEPGVRNTFRLHAGETVDLNLVMTVVDTVGPRLTDVRALNRYQVLLEWNEELHRTPPDPHGIRIADSGGAPLEILGTSFMPGRTQGLLILHTRALPDTLLTVRTEGVRDLMGNPSIPDSMTFWANDSLPLDPFRVASAFPADGLTDIPPAGPYTLTLNAWVPLDSIAARYSVIRVSDGARVEGSFHRDDALSYRFVPEQHLTGQMQYRVDLREGLATLWGDTLSAQSWVFTTGWSTLPGRISGRITGTGRTVTLVLSPAGAAGETRLEIREPGPYLWEDVPPGRYTLAAFVDLNQSGTWDPGEPYGAWPGVLEVLPGLDSQGVDLALLP